MPCHRFSLLALAFALTAQPLFAGFPDTDVLIPAVSRAPGQFNSDFYSTIWITNLAAQQVTVNAAFYQRNQSNTSPPTFIDTLAANETKRYDNVVESLFGLSGVSGAVRVTGGGPLLVSSRTYNLPSSGKSEDSQGLSFSGIPSSFAIGPGEASQLQGITQGADENFRYNFGIVNIEGAAAVVHVSLRDASGTTLGIKDYTVRGWEALQFGVGDIVPGLATKNALLWATVTGGTGRVMLYGTQIANGSNDPSGFEMSFKNSLLVGGGGISGVIAGTGLTGGGTTGIVTLGIAPGGVDKAQLAAVGGSSGQVLGTDGTFLTWQNALTSVAPGNASITIGGTATAPTVAANVGLDWDNIAETNINVRTAAVNVGTVTLRAPVAGFVLVRFDGQATASTGDRLVLAASNASETLRANDGNVSFEGDGNSHPFSHTRVYAVSAGTYTFYAVAQNAVHMSGTGLASVYATLTATFYPNRY